jgi:hypothetical protein
LEIGDFLADHSNFDAKQYHIIIDNSIVDFQLEKLSNCSWIDAFRVLRCQKKLVPFPKWVFLLRPRKPIFCGKSNWYIQKNVIRSPNLLEDCGLNNGNAFFLMEYIIAGLCHQLMDIEDESWWLYVADHCSSGIKIIAGIGNGILLSRILPSSAIGQIDGKILQTIRFLKRFGFVS